VKLKRFAFSNLRRKVRFVLLYSRHDGAGDQEKPWTGYRPWREYNIVDCGGPAQYACKEASGNDGAWEVITHRPHRIDSYTNSSTNTSGVATSSTWTRNDANAARYIATYAHDWDATTTTVIISTA